MEIYKEIICKELGYAIYDALGAKDIDYTGVVNLKSLQALEKIKAIIKNDSLRDFECVEEIVSVLEYLGSNGGSRHDF